jgi:hypothetical protein
MGSLLAWPSMRSALPVGGSLGRLEALGVASPRVKRAFVNDARRWHKALDSVFGQAFID